MSDTFSKKLILFICTGNTCRSPMAQGLFEQLLKEHNLSDTVETRSAGVSAYSGDSANPHTLNLLSEENINYDNFRSSGLSSQLLDEAHLVFAMTESHLFALQDFSPENEGKYLLVTNFKEDGSDHNSPPQISDPIGLGPNAYQKTAEQLKTALQGIISHLKAQA